MKQELNTRILAPCLVAVLGLHLATGQVTAVTLAYTNTAVDAWMIPENWSPNTNWATGTWQTNIVNTGLRVNVGSVGASLVTLTYDATMGTTTLDTSLTTERCLAIGSTAATAAGTLNITGGTLRCIASNGIVGVFLGGTANMNTTNTLHVNGGTLDCSTGEIAVLYRGTNTAWGRLTVSDGTLLADAIAFGTFGDPSVSGRGDVNLNGGTTVVRTIKAGGVAGKKDYVVRSLNLDGGSLRAAINSTVLIDGSFPALAAGSTASFTVTLFDHPGTTFDIPSDVSTAIAAPLGGAGGFTKTGLGTLNVKARNNSFTGPIAVDQGHLLLPLPLASSAFTVANNAKLTLVTTNSAWTLASAALTNSTIEFDYGSWPANGYTNAVLNVANLALSGSVTCNITGTGFPVTNLTLLTYAGGPHPGGQFVLGTLPPGLAATLLDDGSSVTLQITAPSIQNLTWANLSNDGLWQTNGAANWNPNNSTYLEYPSGLADMVNFDDSYPGGTVTIVSEVRPLAIAVNNNTSAYEFAGSGTISGATGMDKWGTNTLTLGTSNGFTGTVTISGGSGASGGTLYVGHPNALGAASGGTVVSGPANTLEIGTPGGTGVIVSGETVTITGTGVGGARGALRGAATSSGSNVWAGPVILAESETRIGTEDNGNLTVSGPITDGGNDYILLLRPGAGGILTISGTNNSYGSTQTFGDQSGTGVVRLGARNALSTNLLGCNIGIFDLNGYNQTVGGLVRTISGGPGTMRNDGPAPSTLTINTHTNNCSSDESIIDGVSAIHLVKLGEGQQSLNGASLTYSGDTLVGEGRLHLATPNPMVSSITVMGGAALSGEVMTSSSLHLNPSSTLYADPSTPGSLSVASMTIADAPIYVRFTVTPPIGVPVLVLAIAGGIPPSAVAHFQAVGLRGGSFALANLDRELWFTYGGGGATLTWKGNDPGNPTAWDVVTTTNWDNGGSPDLFYLGDAVVFDDTSATNVVVIQAGGLSPSSVSFSHSIDYTVSGGAISGGAAVSKGGSGRVTLANNNSYTGATTVSGGTLVVQNNNALGAKGVGTTVRDGGTLDLGGTLAAGAFNLGDEALTVSGSGVSGAGAVVNNGANSQINAVQQMVLAGNAAIGGASRWDMRGTGNALDMAGHNLTKVGSNYLALVNTSVSNPGDIEIGDGIFGVQLAANLGGSAANTLTVHTNATLDFYRSSVAPIWALVLNDGSRIWAESGSGAGSNIWAGPVTLNGMGTLDANGGNLTIAGLVSGAGSFTKVGPNTATLSGANTYSGGTSVTDGILVAASDAALGSGPVFLGSNAVRLVVNDAVILTNQIVLGGGGSVPGRGLIENSGAGNATLNSGIITISGDVSAGGHFASIPDGTLTVANPIHSSVKVMFRRGAGIFSGGGSYPSLSIGEGTVRLGADNGLSTSATVAIGQSANASLDLAGFSQSLAGLTCTNANAAVVTNSSTTSDSTLTLTGTSAYPGQICDSGVAGSRLAVVVNGGNLALSGANTYSGGTLVTNGTLAINTTTAAGTGSVVVDNGGTLTGDGIISGAVTLHAGSTLAPGISVGTLTAAGLLSSDGTLVMELNRTNPPANCDQLVGLAGVALNGSLAVTNIGEALHWGDSFQLFIGSPLTVGFTNVVLPPLASGLVWVDTLAMDGRLSVTNAGYTLGNGLIAHYPLDGSGTNVTGNGNDGVLSQLGVSFVPGINGQAAAFDGVNGMFEATTTGFPAGNDNRTVSLWARMDAPPSGLETLLFGYGQWQGWNGLFLLLAGSEPREVGFTQYGDSVWGGQWNFGVWHHYAVCNNGDAVSLYQDGQLVASKTMTINTMSGHPFYLGKAYGNYALNGQVDDVRIYNRALSESEVQALHLLQAPYIITHPASQAVLLGESATLTVQVGGLPLFSYQWQQDGADLPGATNASLTLSDVLPDQAGDYRVVVANTLGAITSAVAVVTVSMPDYAGALNNTNLTWNSIGDRRWTVQTNVTHDGVSAARSGAIADGQQTVLETTLTGPGTLTYWWKVSSDGVDALTLFVDGNPVVAAAGEQDWAKLTNYLSAGSHTLQWVYAKDASGSGGQDAAWLDEVSYAPGGTAPFVTVQPTSRAVVPGVGLPTTFSVAANGTPPFYYQWRLDGTNLVGRTSSTLPITNFQSTNAGIYSVVVSNDFGVVVSSNALLEAAQVAIVGGPPVPLGLTNLTTIAGGYNFNLALRRDQTVTAWGTYALVTNVPVGLTGVKSLAGGVYHALALRTNGYVVGWGIGLPAIVPPSVLENVLQIAAAPFHSLALKGDGSIVIWGNSGNPITNVPPDLTNVVSVAGGYSHGMALIADGTVRAWGENSYGQTDVPPDLTNAVAIAAGDNHCVALRSDGKLTFWGLNALSLSNTFATVSNAVAIAARATTALAVKSDGKPHPVVTTPLLSNVVDVAVGYGSVAMIGDGSPFLSSPMAKRTILAGGRTHFYAHATGKWPLHHQWRRNGVNLPGATKPWLELNNVQFADAGDYTVVVSNSLGVLNHPAAATLTVLAPPAITNSPQSLTVVAGTPATFTVGVSGTAPFSYQWGRNGTNIPGAIGASLVLPAAQPADEGDYFVVVTNTFGAVTSAPAAVLTVIVPPSIVTQPESASVVPGTNVAFSVAATGTAPLEYQWRRNGVGLPGATNDSVTLTNVQSSDVGHYTVVVGNAGGSVTSAPAILTVLGPPVIVAGPVSQSVLAGANVSLSVTAGGSPPLGYQWRFNGADMPGQTGSILSLPAVQPSSAGDYTVVVSNVVGVVTSTPPAHLTVITFAATQAGLPAYQSPGPFTISCRVDYAFDRTLFFLSWQPTLPPGWTLQSAAGDANPQISGGQVIFSGALPNPLNFTYTASVPAGQTGPKEVFGGALYFLSGMSSTAFAPASPNPLVADHGALLLLRRSANLGVLTLLGDGGSVYTIQTSTNLPTWQDGWEMEVGYGPVQTNVPMLQPRAFYRAEKVSP